MVKLEVMADIVVTIFGIDSLVAVAVVAMVGDYGSGSNSGRLW